MTKEEISGTIERAALIDVTEQAMARTREYLCQDCLDQRCLTGSPCKAFMLLTKSYAWEIVAEKAELN